MTSHAAAIDRQTAADALLRCGDWFLARDDDEIVSHAEQQARKVGEDTADLPLSDAYDVALGRVERHALTGPEQCSQRGALRRMACGLWWRRQLRRLVARRIEQRERILGRVHDRAGIYVSRDGFRRRQEQKGRNAKLLAEMIATNQHDQEYTLAELAELGLANPDHRRAEMMLRIRDTEEEAKRLGHVAVFYTITCPSRFHVVHKGTARVNRKYQGADPRQAQAYLNDLWRRASAKLGRDGLGFYGLRTVEPHHDGCPHWHLLLFMEPENEPAVTETLRAYAEEDSPGELIDRRGEKTSARFKPEHIDPAKGSAVAYIAKYIAKNINGSQPVRAGVDGDHLDKYGRDLTQAAPRIEAWAATWGIRQFQFFGLPSVTVWREVRRMREADIQAWESATRPDPEASAILHDLHAAATGNRWRGFVDLMGGPMVARNDQPVRPWRIVRQDADGTLADEQTGEMTFDQLGRYGEPVAATWGLIVTSATGEAEYLTRRYAWNIERKGAKASKSPEAGEAPSAIVLDRIRLEREARRVRPGRFHGLRFLGWKLGFGRFAPAGTGVINCTPGHQSPRDSGPATPEKDPWGGGVSASFLAWNKYTTEKAARAEAAEGVRRRIERESRAEARRQMTDHIISLLASGELHHSDLTRETIEAMTV